MDKYKPEELLDFPCHYQFKAIGLEGDDFKVAIIAAASQFVTVTEDAVKCRPSGSGSYQAISLSVTLNDYQQLVDIYAEMRKVAGLKMLL